MSKLIKNRNEKKENQRCLELKERIVRVGKVKRRR